MLFRSVSLDHEIMLLPFTGGLLWGHQTLLRDWVIIKREISLYDTLLKSCSLFDIGENFLPYMATTQNFLPYMTL